MSPKRKLNFNFKKNKTFNLLKNGLRIFFLLIFLHWIFWFTTYAKSANYFEAINDEKIDRHDEKTDKYNSRGLLSEEWKKWDIEEIEEDVLDQIEKRKGLNKNDSIRAWKNDKLPKLKEIDSRIKELEKKDTKQVEKKELDKKRKEYEEEFKKAKDETIKNIQTQLKENELNITELDDNRNWWQRITYDPLKFFLISPLNKIGKTLGLSIFLEIIFKLLVIETLLVLVSYSEAIAIWENLEKMKDDSLSIEEKEQLSQESSSLAKYWLFNGFMFFLFSFCVFIHPTYFDRTSPWFQRGSSILANWYWIIPLFVSTLLSNISTELLSRGHLLNKQELKKYSVNNLVTSFFGALAIFFLIGTLGMNSRGNYLLASLGGLVKIIISTFRVKFFGHREHVFSKQRFEN